jgi:hypothetical protein
MVIGFSLPSGLRTYALLRLDVRQEPQSGIHSHVGKLENMPPRNHNSGSREELCFIGSYNGPLLMIQRVVLKRYSKAKYWRKTLEHPIHQAMNTQIMTGS